MSLSLKLLPLQEQDIPAFATLDAAAMVHWGLAKAMSLSAPPDAPPRQQMIEGWLRKGFARRAEENAYYLKIVDTNLPAKHGASDEGEIIAAAFWSFNEGDETSGKADKAQAPRERELEGEREETKEEPALTGVGAEMRRQWDEFKKDYFPSRPFANLSVLVTHPDHQRRGAGSMLVQWGTDEADKRGIISVLQASQMGLGCYLRQGFEVIREVVMDLKPYGVDEVEIRREMMRQPKSLA